MVRRIGAGGGGGGPGGTAAGRRPAGGRGAADKGRTGGKRYFFRRRKVCKFCADKIDYIDYKDVKLLSGFVPERGQDPAAAHVRHLRRAPAQAHPGHQAGAQHRAPALRRGLSVPGRASPAGRKPVSAEGVGSARGPSRARAASSARAFASAVPLLASPCCASAAGALRRDLALPPARGPAALGPGRGHLATAAGARRCWPPSSRPAHAVMFLAACGAPVGLIAEAMARGRGLRRGCGWAFAALARRDPGGALLRQRRPWRRGPSSLRPPPAPRRSWSRCKAGGMPAEQVEAWTEQVAADARRDGRGLPGGLHHHGRPHRAGQRRAPALYLARRDPGWLDGGEFEGLRWPLGLALALRARGAGGGWRRPCGPPPTTCCWCWPSSSRCRAWRWWPSTRDRLAGPPFLRAAVLVLVLVNPWAPQILALLGLFDIWFDFRKWAEPPERERAGQRRSRDSRGGKSWK